MTPSVKSFSRGEIIFKEGSHSTFSYFIIKGEVEISVIRDGQRVILEKIGKGNSFGEMAPILKEPRSATATATEFTETYIVDENTLDKLLKETNPLVRTIAFALIKRIQRANDQIGAHQGTNSVIKAAALVLELTSAAFDRGAGGVVRIPFDHAVNVVAESTMTPSFRIRKVLDMMLGYKLLGRDRIGGVPQLTFVPGELVSRASGVVDQMGDKLNNQIHSESEFLQLSEAASLCNIEQGQLLLHITRGNVPDDMFLFYRSRLMAQLEQFGVISSGESGSTARGQLLPIFDIDDEKLGIAVAKMEPFELAQLVRGQPEAIADRLLSVLSERRRRVIADAVSKINEVDERLVTRLEVVLQDLLGIRISESEEEAAKNE